MSEAKFTKGPWTPTPYGDVMPIGANYLVASCGGKSGLYRNYEANARLIAAAPDLLEALQVTRGQWIHSANAEQCLAAIAKALGKQS